MISSLDIANTHLFLRPGDINLSMIFMSGKFTGKSKPGQ